MQVIQTIPVLRIFDVEKAREFYPDYVGFRPDCSAALRGKVPLKFNKDVQ